MRNKVSKQPHLLIVFLIFTHSHAHFLSEFCLDSRFLLARSVDDEDEEISENETQKVKKKKKAKKSRESKGSKRRSRREVCFFLPRDHEQKLESTTEPNYTFVARLHL